MNTLINVLASWAILELAGELNVAESIGMIACLAIIMFANYVDGRNS